MKHDLKTLPQFFEAVWAGDKTFELRKDDREPPFSVRDTLLLKEYSPCRKCNDLGVVTPDDVGTVSCPECHGMLGVYSGRHIMAQVAYVLREPGFVRPGWCIMSITGVVRIRKGNQ